MEAIIDILPVTKIRVLKVWWAYFWRSLVTFLAMFVIVILVSIALGIFLAMLLPMVGLDAEHVQRLVRLAGFVLGFLAGLLSSAIPLWLILGKDFGEFRLALITYKPATAPAPDA
jgi:ABC-type sugar transport system permease subunit